MKNNTIWVTRNVIGQLEFIIILQKSNQLKNNYCNYRPAIVEDECESIKLISIIL